MLYDKNLLYSLCIFVYVYILDRLLIMVLFLLYFVVIGILLDLFLFVVDVLGLIVNFF